MKNNEMSMKQILLLVGGILLGILLLVGAVFLAFSFLKSDKDEYEREILTEKDYLVAMVDNPNLQMLSTYNELTAKVKEYEDNHPEVKTQIKKKKLENVNGDIINFKSKYFEVNYIIDKNDNVIAVNGKHAPITDVDTKEKYLQKEEEKKLKELEGGVSELEEENSVSTSNEEGNEAETDETQGGGINLDLITPGQETEGEVKEEPKEKEGEKGNENEKENAESSQEKPKGTEQEGKGQEENEEEEKGTSINLDTIKKVKEKDNEENEEDEELTAVEKRIIEEETSFLHFKNYLVMGITLPINLMDIELNDPQNEVHKLLNHLLNDDLELKPKDLYGEPNRTIHNMIYFKHDLDFNYGNAIENDKNMRLTIVRERGNEEFAEQLREQRLEELEKQKEKEAKKNK